MNHTQTAQAAIAQAAAGQVPEMQVEQTQEQTIQIGFEKALVMMNPDWRNALSVDQVNQFRHFYHQGVQHVSFLIQMSAQNMQQNLDAVMQTVIVTGNEEKIAQMQRDAQAAKEAEEAATATEAAPTKKAKAAHKAPTKAAPKKVASAKAVKAAKPAAKKGTGWK
jgi:hypothetical protein